MTVHTDDKPHTCTSYDKMFSLRSSLTRNMLLHRADGPKVISSPDDNYTTADCVTKLFSENKEITITVK